MLLPRGGVVHGLAMSDPGLTRDVFHVSRLGTSREPSTLWPSLIASRINDLVMRIRGVSQPKPSFFNFICRKKQGRGTLINLYGLMR